MFWMVMPARLTKSSAELRAQRCPGRQVSLAEKGFGGPRAKVGGKHYAVARVSAGNDSVVALRMPVENGSPLFAEKDGAAPSMSEADVRECRMQTSNALFNRREQTHGLGTRNVHLAQIVRGRWIDQTCSPNDGVIEHKPSPEVRQVYCIERLPRAESDLLNHIRRERCRCGSQREPWAGLLAVACERQ